MRNEIKNGRTVLVLALSGRQAEVPWEQLTEAEWEHLLTIAKAEGVAPLLSWVFRSGSWPPAIPAPIRSRLTNLYYDAIARSVMLHQELNHVLAAFTRAGIPVVVLKGAALATTLYPKPALRPMGDLDLLVRSKHLAHAEAIVKELRFTPEPQKIGLGMESLLAYEANFDGGREMSIHLELHWNLIGGERSRYRPRIEWFWQRTQSIELSGVPTLMLDPTANLLYLTAHLMIKHSVPERRLIWFYDLHLLIKDCGDHIDWGDLIGRAAEFGWLPALHQAIRQVHDYFDTPVPSAVPDQLAERARKVSYQEPGAESGRVNSRVTSMWHRLSALDKTALFRVLLGLLFPSRAYLRQRYRFRANWLWPLWYVYRWGDMILDSVLTMARLTFCRKPRH